MEQSVTAQEMVAGIWRRRRLAAAVALAVFAAGAAVAISLPASYRATAVVRVEALRPSAELVQPSISQLIEDRLKTVRHELLARPILEKTILEMDLFPALRKQKGMSTAVARLREWLDVKVEGENAFELAVTGPDRQQVALIANRIPELFAEQTLDVRARQASIAATLFDDELERIGNRAQALEHEIAVFKIAHLGSLPEQMEANMRGLERLMALMNNKSDARRELQRRSADLEASRFAADTEVGRLRRAENELSRAVVGATSQWTDDHPEVHRLTREAESVQVRRAAAEVRAGADDSERRGLRGQLRSLDADLKRLEEEAAVYRQRLDEAPKWGQELSVLNRDYEMLRTKYQSLLSRKVEAEVARDLEAKGRASMFHVLSAAAAPSEAFKPDRVAGLALALLAALGLGGLAAVFRELQDDSLRRVEHARAMSMQVLAVVPTIPAGRTRRKVGQARGR